MLPPSKRVILPKKVQLFNRFREMQPISSRILNACRRLYRKGRVLLQHF
jgi:hypothetical protein